jgi:D-alanyl-D-alanine carboxypeptidase (penicillin-binding protein 5/6)
VAQDLYITLPRGEAQKLKADLQSQQPLIAPVAAGQKVGSISISLEDKKIGTYPVVANETVAVAGFFGRMLDSVRLWFK